MGLENLFSLKLKFIQDFEPLIVSMSISISFCMNEIKKKENFRRDCFHLA